MNKLRLLYFVSFAIALTQVTLAEEYSNPETSEKIQLVVFGDSWSDDGNVCKATNDRVWNEYITDLNPNYIVYNYAACGAKTKDLATEITAFMKEPPVDGAEIVVYVIWIGGNDYIGLAEQLQDEAVNAEDPISLLAGASSKVLQLQKKAPTRIFSAVDELLANAPGKKKYVLVGTLPNFSMFPATSPLKVFLRFNLGVDLLFGNTLDTLSTMHNAQVSHKVDSYSPTQNVRLLNFYYFFNQVVKDPKNHGIENFEFVCATLEKCDSELFHDVIHFNHQGHYLIASYVNERISALLSGSEDLNDVHNKVGLEAVKAEIEEAIDHGVDLMKGAFSFGKELFNKYAPTLRNIVKKNSEKIKDLFGSWDEFKFVDMKCSKKSEDPENKETLFIK